MLILVDSSGLAYSCFYGNRGWGAPKDDAIGGEAEYAYVMYGFFNSVLRLGLYFKTNRFVFGFDSRHSLRREMYKLYKNKPLPPEKKAEKMAEKNVVHGILDSLRTGLLFQMGFRNLLYWDGYECDDLLAAITFSDVVEPMVIVTTDEDMYQCLRANVSIYNPRFDRIVTYDEIYNEKGIKPELWWRVKALAGCSSDNVKGIDGIGEVRAIKYLRGELEPGTKYYDSIMSAKCIRERNVKLVKLPFKDTPVIPLVDDKFSKAGFMEVCDLYGFNTFKNERLTEWKCFFKGDFRSTAQRIRAISRNRLGLAFDGKAGM